MIGKILEPWILQEAVKVTDAVFVTYKPRINVDIKVPFVFFTLSYLISLTVSFEVTFMANLTYIL